MPSEVRVRVRSLLMDFSSGYPSEKMTDIYLEKILAVIGEEIEGMKEIYPHEETCRCKECVGVYYKNKTLTDLRARLEGK